MNPLMYDGFFTAVLARGGLAPDVPRLRYFRNQALAENSGADFNPLATEEPGGENPVRPLWNPQGVRNYAGWQEGVDATYATLAQSNFVALWQAIARCCLP